MRRYDCVVAGTGPAGLEAAINLKIRGKSFVLLGPSGLSRKLALAPRIDNYLGLPAISGEELIQKYLEHLRLMDIIITDEHATMVYDMGGYFSIASKADTFEATAVILATGAFTADPFPGEDEFLGRGVGYCATCDAALYRGKTVAVLGFGDESVKEADFVSEIAKTVYYIPVKPAKKKPGEKVKVLSGKVTGISGENRVSALTLDGSQLFVDGVFILRESIAPQSLVPGLMLDGDGFIKVDEMMRTNLLGLYAAGDCTGKPHQFMRAAGQGQTAALEAVSYIDSK
ncbi:MAG: NAD(P)/FAD-dependent oxidoreductase [Oscillospiraceae bacterium]|nr:NAD(P)/FAD-dependent oxidoreductase [Oscillospiraceae bacterium]